MRRAPRAGFPTGLAWPTSLIAKYSTRQLRSPELPRTRCANLCSCASLAGGGLTLVVAGEQRGGHGQHLVGKLLLGAEQLLGEVVAAGHDVLRLRQPVGERDIYRRDLAGNRLDGLDPALERVERHLLALADGAQ